MTVQIACKDEHVGNDWSPYTKPQPERGHFWMKVKEIERGTLPEKVKVDWIPIPCMHCEEAPCLKACPNRAIYQREDGIVMIDPATCKGTGNVWKPVLMDLSILMLSSR